MKANGEEMKQLIAHTKIRGRIDVMIGPSKIVSREVKDLPSRRVKVTKLIGLAKIQIFKATGNIKIRTRGMISRTITEDRAGKTSGRTKIGIDVTIGLTRIKARIEEMTGLTKTKIDEPIGRTRTKMGKAMGRFKIEAKTSEIGETSDPDKTTEVAIKIEETIFRQLATKRAMIEALIRPRNGTPKRIGEKKPSKFPVSYFLVKLNQFSSNLNNRENTTLSF